MRDVANMVSIRLGRQLEDIFCDQCSEGEVRVIGITGRAGAGKTTIAGCFLNFAEIVEQPVAVLGLDAFFCKSSGARKSWLEEARKNDPVEYERRCNMMLWWNFERTKETLERIKRKHRAQLDNIYDRANRGELTGQIVVHLVNGGVLVFEGVAIAHLRAEGVIDHLVCVEADPEVRRARLFGRDSDRRSSNEAAEERWRITESFEDKYFAEYGRLADRTLSNNV